MSVRHTPLPQLSGLPVDQVARCACRRLGAETPAVLEVATLHVHALVAAAEWNSPDLLAEQLGWECSRLAGAGVTLRYRELPEAVMGALVPHVDRVTHARLRVVQAQAERLDRGATTPSLDVLDPDVDLYLAHALAGDHAAATHLVRTALCRGVAAAALVRDLLLPAQVETGRRWEAGEISVAQEHRVTAVTVRCLGLLGGPPESSSRSSARRRVVVATVGAEGHDLGLRMLTQVLEQAGWEVDHLGAAVPPADLAEHVRTTGPDVLALSTTMTAHVSDVARVVSLLREAGSSVRVLVGGRVFASRPALARAVGADATAADADSAQATCRAWFPEPPTADRPPIEATSTPDLSGLAARYHLDARHVDGALALLSRESGLSREDLLRRLTTAGQRRAPVAP